MNAALKGFFKQGAIRISREKERAIYFYATMVLIALYLLNRFLGVG